MSVEDLANSMLEKLKGISQAETVIGKPIQAGEATIVPVSRVSLAFGLGGNKGKIEMTGSGGGISVEPIAFLVVNAGEVKLLPVNGKEASAVSKLVDLVPDVVEAFKKDEKKADA